MSGVSHPVGPQPPEVYWRRRFIAVMSVLVVLGIVVKLFSHFTADPVAAATPLPSQSVAVSASPTTSPAATESATPSESPSIDPSADPAAAAAATPMSTTPSFEGECPDSVMSVTVAIDRTETKVGDGLHMTMTVKNTSDKKCLRDVGSGANEITIISGPALIYSTDHCNPSTEKDIQEFDPGEKFSVNVVWTGKLSAKGCQKLSTADAGAYWAHARNGHINSDGVRFIVQ